MITAKCPNCDCVIHVDTTSKPQTNAERIRSMTDEELAEFLMKETECLVSSEGNYWLDWLKQEASE